MKSRVAQPAGVWERAKESSRAVDMRAQDDDKQRSERRAHNLMKSAPGVKANSQQSDLIDTRWSDPQSVTRRMSQRLMHNPST